MVLWVVRHRTTADTDGVTARDMFTSRSLKWDELASLKLDGGKVSAVGTDGTATRLPGVRLRHLSLLSKVSNGRIPDPAATPEAHGDEESPATPDTPGE
nr:PH domain-containing protein [Kibdelosporangium phytohabitans]